MTAPAADLLDHLQRLDRQAAMDLVRRALDAGEPASSVVTDLLAPAQQLVGEGWHTGGWTISQEHAATSIIDDLLAVVAAHTPPPSRGRVALVCADGEWHVTPARMAALIWRSAGWDVLNLGGSTPPDHVRASLELLRPDVVALSCTQPLALPGAGRVAAALTPLDVPILAGGGAFGPDRRRSDALGIHGWAPDALRATTTFERWLDDPPTRPVPFAGDGEGLSLEVAMPDLVAAAEEWLVRRDLPGTSADVRQPATVREDLAQVLRFAVVALTVDDPRILHDHLVWLRGFRATRGVPAAPLRAGLEALTNAVVHLPRTAGLLASGIVRLPQDTGQWPGGGPGVTAPGGTPTG